MTHHQDTAGGSMVTVTGWGTTSEGGLGLPNVLHKVTFFKGVPERAHEETVGVMIIKGSMTSIIVGSSLQLFIFLQVTLPVVSDEDCNAAYGAAG